MRSGKRKVLEGSIEECKGNTIYGERYEEQNKSLSHSLFIPARCTCCENRLAKAGGIREDIRIGPRIMQFALCRTVGEANQLAHHRPTWMMLCAPGFQTTRLTVRNKFYQDLFV